MAIWASATATAARKGRSPVPRHVAVHERETGTVVDPEDARLPSTPRAPFAHEHPRHEPPDQRENAQRRAHHAADTCGPEDPANFRDLCARRPPVVHAFLDKGSDLDHAAPPSVLNPCVPRGRACSVPRGTGRRAGRAARGRRTTVPCARKSPGSRVLHTDSANGTTARRATGAVRAAP